MTTTRSIELQSGDKLGVWRLQRPVASLPSGRWWRAQHALSDQGAWVLAYARPEDAGAVLLRMAQSEGQPWRHPDVAWPLDSGLTGDGRPYIVMPMIEGEPLLAAIGQASLRRRLEWVVQLCELLLMAREEGLALVELDPSLLWLGPHQQLRLAALALVRTDAVALRMGALQGQISHAAQALRSPEGVRGEPGGEGEQVFAVGMLMCLLVNGRLPHEPEPVRAPVQALTQWLALKPESRATLDALLRDTTASDPAQRPASLADLAQAIETWIEDAGGMASTEAGALAARHAAPAPAPEASRPTVPAAAPLPPAAPTPPRGLRWLWGAGLLVLGGLGGLAWWWRH